MANSYANSYNDKKSERKNNNFYEVKIKENKLC